MARGALPLAHSGPSRLQSRATAAWGPAVPPLEPLRGAAKHAAFAAPGPSRLEPEDEFVLLGSDGLWSVVSSDAAVALARAELQAYGDANMASEKLVEVALRRNADDNVTAMVVLLRPIEQEVRQRPRLALAKAASVPVDLHARGGDA